MQIILIISFEVYHPEKQICSAPWYYQTDEENERFFPKNPFCGKFFEDCILKSGLQLCKPPVTGLLHLVDSTHGIAVLQ